MSQQLATRGTPRPHDLAKQTPACSRSAGELRSVAEEMLREMAFVYHLTRSVKQSMTQKKVYAEATPA